MYKNLPRHTFGFIQSKLFPKYFLLGTVLTSVSIISFVIEHPFGLWKQLQYIQVRQCLHVVNLIVLGVIISMKKVTALSSSYLYRHTICLLILQYRNIIVVASVSQPHLSNGVPRNLCMYVCMYVY